MSVVVDVKRHLFWLTHLFYPFVVNPFIRLGWHIYLVDHLFYQPYLFILDHDLERIFSRISNPLNAMYRDFRA